MSRLGHTVWGRATLALAVATPSLFGASLARGAESAAQPEVESYEVKFNLRPDPTLAAESRSAVKPDLAPSFAKAFRVPDHTPPERMSVRFFDGCGTPLHEAGWSVRLREKEAEREISYKKRYKVQSPKKTQDAVARAAEHGFSPFPPPAFKGKSEVDWGDQEQALSLTLKPRRDSPPAGDLIPFAAENAPPPLTRDPAADRALRSLATYGPVSAWSWAGKAPDDGANVDIEVWRIRDLFVVEVSFKEDKRKHADHRRKELKKFLQKKGWLSAEDSFKTAKVLAEYVPTACR